MTVLEGQNGEGAWPQGLDPATDGSALANQDMLDAIYGNLFELNSKGQNVPDLASGYSVSPDRKNVTINLRPGVRFSDGTPLNATAVVFNWNRDFKEKGVATPSWPVQSLAAPSATKVVIHLTRPYSPLINSMHDSSVNWIVSPTALQKMGGTAFALKPVGAGPFTVVSDTVSATLKLAKNPNYWQKGHPYLDSLTFQDVGGDDVALQALQSGQGQAYMYMTTPSLVKSFSGQFHVIQQETGQPYDVQMNTLAAPFNNKLAREALYYATDAASLDQKLFGGVTKPVQGFTGPGGLFYRPTVPGYRTYNLAKAKAIVKQLGGLRLSLMSGQTGTQQVMAEALQSMWNAAGMQVTLKPVTLPGEIQAFSSHNWQACFSTDGSFDPATGLGQMFRFLSTATFSGVKDKKLDSMLMQATEVPEPQRGALYAQIAQYESTNAYTVQLFPSFVADIAAKNIYAPGMTTVAPTVADDPETWWEDAGFIG